MSIIYTLFTIIDLIYAISLNPIGLILLVIAFWRLFNSLNIKPYYALIPFYNIWLFSRKAKQKNFVFEVFAISYFVYIVYVSINIGYESFFFYDFISLALVVIGVICWTILAINIGKIFNRSTLFGFGLAFLPVVFFLYLAFNHAPLKSKDGAVVGSDKDKIYAQFKSDLPDDFISDRVLGGEAFFNIGYLVIMNIPLWFQLRWQYVYFTPTSFVYVERELWKGLHFCISIAHEDIESIQYTANKFAWSKILVKAKDMPEISMKVKPVFAKYIDKNNTTISQLWSNLELQKI